MECSLVSGDFFQATPQKLEFTECNIDQALLSGVKLKGMDLSDCNFDSLHVDIEDLDGCIISDAQAASFVGLLGLIVK
jgi:uncharacterized protein YjbI with pentapeptide repeats